MKHQPKIVRVLSYFGTSHVRFARFGLQNATRSLVQQPGIFLRMKLQRESWDNLGELGRAAEICVDLWESVKSLQCAVLIVGCLVGFEIKRKCMNM